MKASDQQTLSLCAASIYQFRATTILTPCLSKVPHPHWHRLWDKCRVLLDKSSSPAPGRGKPHLLKTTFKKRGLPSFQLSMQQWQEMRPLSSPAAATFRGGYPHLTLLQRFWNRRGCVRAVISGARQKTGLTKAEFRQIMMNTGIRRSLTWFSGTSLGEWCNLHLCVRNSWTEMHWLSLTTSSCFCWPLTPLTPSTKWSLRYLQSSLHRQQLIFLSV